MLFRSPMKMCGIKGAPADAVSMIKANADYVTEKNAGSGAVREFIEWIVRQNGDKNEG